jgi:hypothetical protein
VLLVVVSPEPLCGLVLRFLIRFKDVLAQPFAGDGAIVALDISVQLGFDWLDVFKPNAVFSIHAIKLQLIYSGPLSTQMVRG